MSIVGMFNSFIFRISTVSTSQVDVDLTPYSSFILFRPQQKILPLL